MSAKTKTLRYSILVFLLPFLHLPTTVFGVPLGPFCFVCSRVSTINACVQAVRCGNEQQCYVEEMLDDGMGVTFNMGCEKQTTCNISAKHPSVPVGRRGEGEYLSRDRRVPVTSCFKCCSENHCNKVDCKAFCPVNPCQHGATCTSDRTGRMVQCHCPPGYNGTHCEIDIDECQPNPCQNGGVCHQGVNTYSCVCPAGFGGIQCQIKIPKCFYCNAVVDPRVCHFEQTCQPQEECFTDAVYVGLNETVTFNLGCRSRQFCSSYKNLFPNPVGKRAHEIVTCFECCTGDHCNREKCLAEIRPRRSCQEYLTHGHRTSGVYTIDIGDGGAPIDVFCDMVTEGGGWVVFQRRQDGSMNFYRNWTDYQNGFGDLSGEFWLGLDKIHRMTMAGLHKLHVDLRDWENGTAFADYSYFIVGDAASFYTLLVSGYNGTAGDSLVYHTGRAFTTVDADHDSSPQQNCAVENHGAWWYASCHTANLNGFYAGGINKTYIAWATWKNKFLGLKFTEMKVR